MDTPHHENPSNVFTYLQYFWLAKDSVLKDILILDYCGAKASGLDANTCVMEWPEML